MNDDRWTSKRRAILREHEKMRATVREIEIELDRMIEHPAQPAEPWGLPGLVETLRGHFRAHFEIEENGGLLGAAPECYDSGTLRVVDALIAEHREIEAEIERILSEFDFSFVPGEIVQVCFDGELRRLIARLAVHEAAENALFNKLSASS